MRDHQIEDLGRVVPLAEWLTELEDSALCRASEQALRYQSPTEQQLAFFEYNDNGYGRFSCYDRLPIDLTYELEEFLQASAREKMSARANLREWLAARGEDPAQYGLESWEKIL